MLPGDCPAVLAAQPRRRPAARRGERERRGRFALRVPPRRDTGRTTDRPRRRARTAAAARTEAAFVVEGDAAAELLAGLDGSRAFAGQAANVAGNIEALAREWFRGSRRTRRTGSRCRASRSAGGIGRAARVRGRIAPRRPGLRRSPRPRSPRCATACSTARSRSARGRRSRSCSPAPATSSTAWAATSRPSGPRCSAASTPRTNSLPRPVRPDYLLGRPHADEAHARDLMFGQVTVGSLVSDIAVSLGVRCDAMIGLSLGESAGLFGMRAWREPRRDVPADAALNAVQLRSRAAVQCGPCALGMPSGRTRGLGERDHRRRRRTNHRRAAAGLLRVLLIVNTPTECVIGGRPR